MTITEFIEANRITMTAKWADANPNMESRDMDHWKVQFLSRLAGGRPKRMTTYFSMGFAHSGKEPKASEVLDCLASDAAGVENSPEFEEWVRDYGYDADSRKAEKIFNACVRAAEKLKAFLGDERYQALLFDCERE